MKKHCCWRDSSFCWEGHSQPDRLFRCSPAGKYIATCGKEKSKAISFVNLVWVQTTCLSLTPVLFWWLGAMQGYLCKKDFCL